MRSTLLALSLSLFLADELLSGQQSNETSSCLTYTHKLVRLLNVVKTAQPWQRLAKVYQTGSLLLVYFALVSFDFTLESSWSSALR